MLSATRAWITSAGPGWQRVGPRRSPGHPSSAANITEALVVFLLGQPTALAKLLAQHVDDGTGRCRVCSSGQRGHLAWPCFLRIAADRAHALGQGDTRR